MGASSQFNARARTFWLGFIAVFLCLPAGFADSVDVSPTAAGYAIDGGAEFGWVMDGTFDAIYVNDQVVVRKYRSQDFTKYIEHRGVYEFKLPDVLMAEGVVLESAVLYLPKNNSASSFGDYLRVYGYVADGLLQTTDFVETDNNIASVDVGSSSYAIDVTDYVASQVGMADFVGFNLDVSWWEAYVSLDPAAELQIVYDVTGDPVNEPPVLEILQPDEGLTHYEGVPITFVGSSTDAEDGDLSDTIDWFSVYYELPTGSEFSQAFFATTHTVHAWVVDSAGESTTISVSFEVMPNAVPEITLFSPLDGSELTVGDSVLFEAQATDVEDGNINESIQWTSSIDGFLGAGSSFSTTQLSLGQHIITASIADGVGAEASSSVNIEVHLPLNTPPVVTITSPYNGATFLDSDLINFAGQAYDNEDGDRSYYLLWLSDLSGTLGQGPTVTAQLSPGTHTITAQVLDTQGSSGGSSISIVVELAASYCAAAGLYTNYEWIEGVSVAGFSNTSGPNLGYADFTGDDPIELERGANTVDLQPGFRYSGYREYWSVWIDFDQDSLFSDEELVFSGNTTASLSGYFNVPAGAPEGLTRMRVVMRYGAPPSPCGSFTYGEVEDYSVTITGEGDPVPPVVEYCSSYGMSTSYEWIKRIKAGSFSWISGNSHGYTDHTGGASVDLRIGWPLTLVLEPGFGYGSYTEHWRVWVDTNQDGELGVDELLYSGSSSSTITTQITAPETAVTGITRMRVSMKYGGGAGPCGSFSYGEVEDFDANILK